MFQPGLLQGRRILVTGGGTGLGRAMATRFAGLGARLVLCGRRKAVLEEAARAIEAAHGGSVELHDLDLRDAAAVEAMMAHVFEGEGLDVLVNNAAANFIARSETLSPRAVDAVLGIVLHGAAYVTLACGRRWIAAERPGTVLSIVTTYAWTGSAYVVPSAMAKAGVLAMTRSLAVEWGRHGIRLNAVAPGPFPTQGAWERLVPRADLAEEFERRNALGRVGRHEELADLAAYLMSERSGYITGDCITIDGGEWIKGAGQFNFLDRLSAADWDALKPKKG